MSTPVQLSDIDWQVRAFVFRHWIDSGHAPTLFDAADALHMDAESARAAFHRLDQRHLIVLAGESESILMAHPFSGVETGYRVHALGRTYDANCAWDSAGIPAMLAVDAEIEGVNGLTGERARYAVRDGKLVADDFLIHFLVPLRHWYDDLVHT